MRKAENPFCKPFKNASLRRLPGAIIAAVLFNTFLSSYALAQSEVMAWGNLTGIRVEGHLIYLALFDRGIT
jgi:hypothetical protein